MTELSREDGFLGLFEALYVIEKDNTLLNCALFVYNSTSIAVTLTLSKLAGKFA